MTINTLWSPYGNGAKSQTRITGSWAFGIMGILAPAAFSSLRVKQNRSEKKSRKAERGSSSVPRNLLCPVGFPSSLPEQDILKQPAPFSWEGLFFYQCFLHFPFWNLQKWQYQWETTSQRKSSDPRLKHYYQKRSAPLFFPWARVWEPRSTHLDTHLLKALAVRSGSEVPETLTAGCCWGYHLF